MMTAKEIESLEGYFKSENQHWNSFTFTMICEVLTAGQFQDPELPLHLFARSIEIFSEHHKSPLKAVDLLGAEVESNSLAPMQELFVYKWICKYLSNSEFDNDLTQIQTLLASRKDRLRAKVQPTKPMVRDIRETLKEMLQKELETLPTTLKELDPGQRLNIVCKLIPFILPRVDAVHHTEGEH